MNALATPRAPQHLRALEQANAVRLARAELKRQIAGGGLDAADVVLEPPDEALSMNVADLIMSQHRWGRTRCRRLLQAIPLSENKPLGTLTERQRVTLAERLRTA